MTHWMDSKDFQRVAQLGLPVPRLQFTWIKITDDWSIKECIYTLVLPLGEHDIRREGPNGKKVRSEWHAEIGRTKSDGSARMPVSSDGVDTPFRDGAHAQWDALVLNLPLFAVCDGVATRVNVKTSRVAI
jgi:hypothetical protein